MGQQQTVAGSALRRIILVLAVAALMTMLSVAMANPAFASASKCQGNGCSFGRAISGMASGESTGQFNLPSGHASGQGQANANDFGSSFPPGQP